MLRPKDDAVFSGAKLRYIVLDEAHIYEGAEGATAVLGTQLFEQLPSEEMALLQRMADFFDKLRSGL
ncbi:MAG: hypothetical protein HFF54_06835 [Lawsonibacter sp.]|nr:hypothetical protein [Lawsonibacter sp.]